MTKYRNPLNIGSLGNCLQAIRDRNFTVIDLTAYDFIDVYSTMVLALAVRYMCQEGMTPDIRLPESEDATAYLARQDFFKTISTWYSISDDLVQLQNRQWSQNPRVAPLTVVKDESDVSPVVNRVRDILTTRDFGVSVQMADDIWRVLSELIQNIPQHASLGLTRVEPGLAVLQRYPQSLDIAVGDIGIGLGPSLRLNPSWQAKSDAELQTLVLTEGISRTGERGRGNGLYRVAMKIGQMRGVLRLQSGSVATYWRAGGHRTREATPFPGTQVWISIPCRT